MKTRRKSSSLSAGLALITEALENLDVYKFQVLEHHNRGEAARDRYREIVKQLKGLRTQNRSSVIQIGVLAQSPAKEAQKRIESAAPETEKINEVCNLWNNKGRTAVKAAELCSRASCWERNSYVMPSPSERLTRKS